MLTREKEQRISGNIKLQVASETECFFLWAKKKITIKWYARQWILEIHANKNDLKTIRKREKERVSDRGSERERKGGGGDTSGGINIYRERDWER